MELLQFYYSVRALETVLTSIRYAVKESDPTHNQSMSVMAMLQQLARLN